MTQLPLWEKTNALIDAHFPLACAKASALSDSDAAQARRAKPAVARHARLERSLHAEPETLMDDSERYGELPERVDSQTGFVAQRGPGEYWK